MKKRPHTKPDKLGWASLADPTKSDWKQPHGVVWTYKFLTKSGRGRQSRPRTAASLTKVCPCLNRAYCPSAARITYPGMSRGPFPGPSGTPQRQRRPQTLTVPSLRAVNVIYGPSRTRRVEAVCASPSHRSSNPRGPALPSLPPSSTTMDLVGPSSPLLPPATPMCRVSCRAALLPSIFSARWDFASRQFGWDKLMKVLCRSGHFSRWRPAFGTGFFPSLVTLSRSSAWSWELPSQCACSVSHREILGFMQLDKSGARNPTSSHLQPEVGSETTHASGRHFPAQGPVLGDVLGMGDQSGGTWAEESRAAMRCSGIEYVPWFSVTRLQIFVTGACWELLAGVAAHGLQVGPEKTLKRNSFWRWILRVGF